MNRRFASQLRDMACAALMIPLCAFGQEPAVAPAQEPELLLPAPVEDAVKALDVSRDYLSGKFVDFVRNVDSFFGDDRNYQESNDSVLQIDISRVVGYGGERKFVLAGRAKLHLPVAEKSLHLLLETDPDKNATVNPTQSQTPIKKTDAPESYAAALRYEKAGAERWHFSADGGLQFAGLSSSPFARTRASLAMPVDDAWRMKLAESVFWFNTIGAGESTQLDFERPVSEPILFRATSSATWLNDKQNFDLRQDLSLFHTLSERTALLYQASAIGVSRPQTQVTDYVLLLSYRYRLHQDWMFFDLSPQLHFPKERGFRSSGVLSMRLEMLFDQAK